MILAASDKRLDSPHGLSSAVRDGSADRNQPAEHRALTGLDTEPGAPAGVDVSEGRRASRRDRRGELVAGRYRILRLLGRGGMGSVWLALDGALSRPVALKESWRSEPSPSDECRASTATREARAACVVSHRGLVQVYDLVVEDGHEWIVMEALSGTSLAQVIGDHGKLPAERVIEIGLRLLEALQALHHEGVIHGDVKPANVQLDGTGHPVLTDFGLASRADDVAVADTAHVVGSPPYMAPEVIRTGTRSSASDLFALGATLYEAAEGLRPFRDATPVGITLAVLNHSPKPALDGAPLGQVIDGLLIKDPRNRWSAQDAHARLTELEAALVGPAPRLASPPRLAAC